MKSKYLEKVLIYRTIFGIYYQYYIFDYLIYCKICCHRNILRVNKRVNVKLVIIA